MQKAFESVALIGKITNPDIRQHVLALARFLDARGIRVMVEQLTARHLDIEGFPIVALNEIGQRAGLAVVLGGDGPMLMAARELVNCGVPLVGVNQGHLGFLTDLTTASMLESISRMLAGEYTREQRLLLGASIVRDGRVESQGHALNDVVISKGGVARLIDLELTINGEFVHRQRSDGLIVSTPTGTTAYALSAGGPLLHPTLDAIVLVPICPHTLSNRPFAINSMSRVEITLCGPDDALMHFDGQLHAKLHCGDKVVVQRLEQAVTLLHPLGHSHYAMLREKLHWG
jgi:NAD+ kinase